MVSAKLETSDTLFQAKQVLFRIDIREGDWGDALMNFVLAERDVLRLKASPIRRKVSFDRFHQIVSGARLRETWIEMWNIDNWHCVKE